VLKEDLSWICDNADGIAMLFGCDKSKGAQAELALAHALGIPTNMYMGWVQEAEIVEIGDGFDSLDVVSA
jgi:hypothetical protein